jgi:histidinol-phosphate/aromatic aminotransferase/cobyric acid decarboxylase-like protein
LVELPVEEAAPVIAELARRGIFVRSFPSPTYGLGKYLRVTVGSTADNDTFVMELEDILSEMRSAA